MDEYVDILTAAGKPTGRTCLKSEAHQKGYYHPTVHIWCYTKDLNVLLQQRIATKATFPGLWDVSVAGHIAAGEDSLTAAVREIQEEIGLSIPKQQLSFIGTWKSEVVHPNGIQDNEFHQIYLTEIVTDLPPLQLQKEEVANVGLYDLSILKDTKKYGNFLVPHAKAYYDFITEKVYFFGAKKSDGFPS